MSSALYTPSFAHPYGYVIYPEGPAGPGASHGVAAGAPTDGTSGTLGYCPGGEYIDSTNGNIYQNTGTKTSPTWKKVLRDGSTVAALTVTQLTATNAAITNASIPDSTLTNAAIANAALTNATLATTLTAANAANFALGTGSGSMLGTASGQKLALWGATPVIQPATATQTSGETGLASSAALTTNIAVTNTSTFNGGSGTKAYTVNAVVQALKQAGILASS